MANKKKPAPKKASKPVKKTNNKKPAPKKPATKAAPKKAAKLAPKKAAPQKPAKLVAKKPAEKAIKPVEKRAPGHENKSLVSVKPQIKQIVKKEPPKPGKVVIPKTTTKSVKKYEPEFTKSVLDSQSQDPGAPVHRYSDAELVEFREIITKKLDAAKKELNYLQGLITRKDESGDMDEGRYMTMEDGSVSMEREQLSQMASRQITFIDHLEKAMMRIENKTYGICRVTGKLIDKARLRAVPHATLSIEAKQMMNK
ncbi:MAG TPA: TraR/DksA C4-type zinc finger protein [Chitinophagaceae bacterium]|nr:TraR/DksA C4-type zinc finger protein [Chitinophagaceae bacterium]